MKLVRFHFALDGVWDDPSMGVAFDNVLLPLDAVIYPAVTGNMPVQLTLNMGNFVPPSSAPQAATSKRIGIGANVSGSGSGSKAGGSGSSGGGGGEAKSELPPNSFAYLPPTSQYHPVAASLDPSLSPSSSLMQGSGQDNARWGFRFIARPLPGIATQIVQDFELVWANNFGGVSGAGCESVGQLLWLWLW